MKKLSTLLLTLATLSAPLLGFAKPLDENPELMWSHLAKNTRNGDTIDLGVDLKTIKEEMVSGKVQFMEGILKTDKSGMITVKNLDCQAHTMQNITIVYFDQDGKITGADNLNGDPVSIDPSSLDELESMTLCDPE